MKNKKEELLKIVHIKKTFRKSLCFLLNLKETSIFYATI